MMQIESIHLYNESITDNKMIDSKSQTVDFEEVMNNEVKKNTSIEELVKEIESNYNSQITMSLDSFSANPVKGLDNVIIGKETLEKMKNNSVFREKIMKVIDECCSSSAQQEIRSLSPPAKSAGVIIYPDGSYLCWIESIYSDSDDIEGGSKNDNFVIKGIKNTKESRMENVVEQYNHLEIVADISVIDKRRSK